MLDTHEVLALDVIERPEHARSLFNKLGRMRTKELSQVHESMKSLSMKTKGIEGKGFYLEVYARKLKGNENVSIRWRLVGRRHTHVTWAVIEPLLVRLPAQMSRWYVGVNSQAQVLNLWERYVRSGVKYSSELAEVIGG